MAAPATQLSTGLINLSSNQAIRLLAFAKSVNVGITGDTALPLIATAKYSVSNVIVTNASASLAQAVAGLYTATGGGGTTIVTTAALSAATGSTIVIQQTVASTAVATVPNLYYRVTTANTAAATADVYVYGYDFS
jgi:hypothetical protein